MQDYEFIRPLGDAVKRARSELGLTQNEVAERIGVDVRTILNIENYKGNLNIPPQPEHSNRQD